jgi:hypothetical protein
LGQPNESKNTDVKIGYFDPTIKDRTPIGKVAQ